MRLSKSDENIDQERCTIGTNRNADIAWKLKKYVVIIYVNNKNFGSLITFLSLTIIQW